MFGCLSWSFELELESGVGVGECCQCENIQFQCCQFPIGNWYWYWQHFHNGNIYKCWSWRVELFILTFTSSLSFFNAEWQVGRRVPTPPRRGGTPRPTAAWRATGKTEDATRFRRVGIPSRNVRLDKLGTEWNRPRNRCRHLRFSRNFGAQRRS